MLRNHEAYTVAKTTVCMCGGVWVCVCVAYKYRLCRQRGDWNSGGYMPTLEPVLPTQAELPLMPDG